MPGCTFYVIVIGFSWIFKYSGSVEKSQLLQATLVLNKLDLPFEGKACKKD